VPPPVKMLLEHYFTFTYSTFARPFDNYDSRANGAKTRPFARNLPAVCHPERSEGSWRRAEVLRFAQDDNSPISIEMWQKSAD